VAAKAGVEQQAAAGFGRFAGAEMDQRPPFVQQTLDQQLDAPAAGLAAVQAGRDHPGVVEHQQVAGAQQFRQVIEPAVAERAGCAVQGQQPAVAAPGRGVLGDQFRRQVEAKILALEFAGGFGWLAPA
jgi:hypothetical protein